MRGALAIVVVSAGMFAQPAPPPCPADRPVDEIIAEIQKLQSKKKNRNANPLPEFICVFGWCSDRIRTPKTTPKAEPREETPDGEDQSSSGTSSSTASSGTASSGGMTSSRSSREKLPEKCDEAMEKALAAAHNVEVGDYYFDEKKYRAALLRYNDALEEKPGDAAIHVRLGRVLEKLNESARAIEHYQAAQKLGAPQKWAEEAKSALSRLQPPSS